MKKSHWLLFVVLSLLASAAFSYEVTERYRLGASAEGMTYVTNGPLAGKAAAADGWYVYTLDPASGNYQKAFCVAGMGLPAPPRGIAYISQGEFAGDFLFSDSSDPNTLYLVTSTGTLVGAVEAQGFQWKYPEGLTQITSGPYQGRIALLGSAPSGGSRHIYVLRLEQGGNGINAFLEKDISNIPNDDMLGIAFLPADFPVVAYRDMFAVTVRQGVDWTLEVFDTQGVQRATSSCIAFPEGLAYIPSGSFAGRLLISERQLFQAAYRNLDGTVSTPAGIPPVGLGLFGPSNFTWLKNSQQFHFVAWDGRFFNMPGYLISRRGPDMWNLDRQFQLTHFYYTRNLTDLTADGTYKLFGIVAPGSPARYAVESWDASFQPLANPIQLPFAGVSFGSLAYVPGDMPDNDRFVAPSGKKIYTFNPLSGYTATITDLSGSVMNNISRLSYDPGARRYYVLDGTWLRVFDTNWGILDSFSLLDAAPVALRAVAKITSGELRGNVALLDADDNELIMLNFEYDIAGDLLSRLIAEVKAAGLAKGLTNSLVSKLENAKKSVEKKKLTPAINQVEAFINEVQAQSGKGVGSAAAEAWQALAAQVVRGLQQLL